jgi:hypothetical protein
VTNRWIPVLRRYIHQISGRVDGFGGHASSIPPSLSGYAPKAAKGRPGDSGFPAADLEFVGKVVGLHYDRFGDFEGFTLETECGTYERFHCEERAIEDLIRRAWIDRYVIAVISRKSTPHVPDSIITRRAPQQ